MLSVPDDDMMIWKSASSITSLLLGETTGHRKIPLTKDK